MLRQIRCLLFAVLAVLHPAPVESLFARLDCERRKFRTVFVF